MELKIDNIFIKLDEVKNTKYLILVHWKECPYSISFMPTWKELKEKFKNFQFFELERDELDKINKIGVINFLKEIDGFPTIVGYDNNKVLFTTFEKERTLENLSDFINEMK
jgi:thiol-disulfide isomerase/thioredoxin